MAGEWVGAMSVEYVRAGAAPERVVRPFTLNLVEEGDGKLAFGAPTSTSGCELYAAPAGDAVTFPSGQVCRGQRDSQLVVATLREGRMAVGVDGLLQLSLTFDVERGSDSATLHVHANLARNASSQT
jgi:hypothetical protein